jgi:hypothetical protein
MEGHQNVVGLRGIVIGCLVPIRLDATAQIVPQPFDALGLDLATVIKMNDKAIETLVSSLSKSNNSLCDIFAD